MWDWFRRWRAGRAIEHMSTMERYALVNGEVSDLIASARCIDPDNGRVSPQEMHMGTSDVLGILLALKRHGYVIRKSWL